MYVVFEMYKVFWVFESWDAYIIWDVCTMQCISYMWDTCKLTIQHSNKPIIFSPKWLDWASINSYEVGLSWSRQFIPFSYSVHDLHIPLIYNFIFSNSLSFEVWFTWIHRSIIWVITLIPHSFSVPNYSLNYKD